MAIPVYSVRLWTTPTSTGEQIIVGPSVPAGYTWVVRDVRIVNVAPLQPALYEAVFVGAIGLGPISATPTWGTLPGTLYQWEGRAIVPQGQALEFSVHDAGWQAFVDGYQLTAV